MIVICSFHVKLGSYSFSDSDKMIALSTKQAFIKNSVKQLLSNEHIFY